MSKFKKCPLCKGKLFKIRDIKVKLGDSNIILQTKTIYGCDDCCEAMAWIYLYEKWQFGEEIWQSL
jgi:hypothetical protein